MRWLEGLENQRPGGCTVWIDTANELYIRFGKYSTVFNKMVSEGSRILSIRAKRITSNPSFPNVWHYS